jgi:tetratricopeptide (TPR) repeat protein
MSLKPKTKVEDLLEKLTSFSRGKVLSEFELTRYLNQAKSVVDFDAAQSWHIRGLIYFYANQVDDMDHSFKSSLRLSRNGVILNNAIACYMNQACLSQAFELFQENSLYFIETIRDFDLVIKLHRLALNLYEIDTINKLIEIITPFNNIVEIQNIIGVINQEVEKVVQRYLAPTELDWNDAKKIANQALCVLKEQKLRPSSVVEIDFLDGEVVNGFYILSDVKTILEANDLLFEKIYTQDLLDTWNKLMFIFICADNSALTTKDVA